jgi:hypothetical protein
MRITIHNKSDKRKDVALTQSRAQIPGQLVVPHDERRFAELLAQGEPLEDIAAEVGWTMDKARRLATSGNMLKLVAGINLTSLHARHVPRALRTISHLMEGYLEYWEIDGNLQTPPDQLQSSANSAPARKVTRVMVKPETRLAAAQTILKMGGYDKPPETRNANDLKDLAEMNPDELRATVQALEAELAQRAAPVNAPDAPLEAIPDAEDASIINVLD